MNIIVRLLSHDPFLEHVARSIVQKAEGMMVPVPTEHREAEGRIKVFQLLGPPVFSGENCDCVGNTCSLPFSGQAKIAGHAEPDQEGHSIPFAGEEEYSGHVDLGWPAGTQLESESDFAALYSLIAIETVVDSVTKANAPPRSGPVPGVAAPQMAK
ncbi:MAG: hypothetical protein EOP86_00935 [Verrucomicrobiaceae bacterium]|nr:MAG: hypothetical protein EOP86_00935 [Verrucomicrobiaceae bacterium]